MTTTILTAFVLGLFAGLAPGPYTTMVAGTALERGFKAGFILALTPLVTDIVPMLFSALLLGRLGWTALTILGIGGGAVIVVVGIRFLREHGNAESVPLVPTDPETGSAEGTNTDSAPPARPAPGTHLPERRQSARMVHVILSTLLNPSPWVFWLVVASPLLLRSWNRSRTEGIVFIVVIFLTNISTATFLAWLASHSRRIMNPAWHRRALKAVGGVLIAAGIFLLWQAAVGNFQSLIDQQEVIRSVVEEGISSM